MASSNVSNANVPNPKKPSTKMAPHKVGSNVNYAHQSSGKMAAGGPVTLGTTKGNHKTGHPC